MNPTNDELFAIPFKRQNVPLPELGPDAAVIVRELSEAESEDLGAVLYPVDKDGNVGFNSNLHNARWVVACAINEDGTRRFADADLKRVAAMPRAIVARLAEAARALNSNGQNPALEAAKN